MNPGDRVEFTTGVTLLNQEMQWINLFNDLIRYISLSFQIMIYGGRLGLYRKQFLDPTGDESLMNNFLYILPIVYHLKNSNIQYQLGLGHNPV